MSALILRNHSHNNITIVENDFIDHYMVSANGEYVKVYLLLLRYQNIPEQLPDIPQMADLLENTEGDILRALKYWEKEGILSLEYDETNELAGICIGKAPTHQTPVKAAFHTPSAQSASVHEKSPVAQSDGNTTVSDKAAGQNLPASRRSLAARRELKQILFIAEQYLGKTLSRTDVDAITYFYDSLGFSADLIEYLVSDGYKVFKAENAEAGLNILDKQDIHLVLLDIMMPGMNGLEMCRKIRETNNIPIIMLSAKSTDLDKILGLGTGADDYVVKPFNPLELTARVKSQLRRYTQLNPNSGARETVNNEITIKGMSINRDNHKVIVDGEEIKLTPIEFDILYLLASNPGKVFSTDEIFEKVWNEKVYEANNTVMVHIRRLRGKMKEDTRQNKIITTVWGVGYKIEK